MAKRTKKRARKKQNKNYTKEIGALITLALAFVGMAKLGFLGRFIVDFAQLLVGQLGLFLLGVVAIVSIYFLLSGNLPKIRNRITLSVLALLPISALLLHAWHFQRVALSGDSLIGVTWQRGIANFLIEPNHMIGGGLLGAILYTMTYFTVSQLGTYLIIGAALITVLCLLFQITWQDLIEGFQLIWATISDWTVQFYHHTMNQWQHYQENRPQAKQEAKTQPTEKSSKRVNKTKEDMPEPASSESHAFEIVGPQSQKQKEFSETPTSLEKAEEPIPQKRNRLTPRQTSSDDVANEMDTEETDADMSELSDLSMDAEHENPNYKLPSFHLLRDIQQTDQSGEYDIIKHNVKKLEETFESFNVDAKVTKANLGPAVTKYEIQPAIGVKVSKIVSLADDIALALAAKDIRIEAPIPGKSFIGIEVPNREISLVSFRDSIENQEKTDRLLNVPLGRDISGAIQSADLTKMPHLLVAGSTGSGKSVAINGMIVSILMKAKPNEVKLMMIDPKKVELNIYNDIPHLLTPVVTNPRKAAQALNKVVEEMERRYELFAASSQRNIDGYNAFIVDHNRQTGENLPKLPYIVVIVDELADLMMVASKEVEAAIMRLAQMARAAGIHMILATQRPSVDVITGIIKANVPSRIAFAVSSGTDSRTIIDQNGAEKLLGRGDMLFMPMGEGKPIRVQGAFITDVEVEAVVNFVKEQQEANYIEAMMPSENTQSNASEDLDELWSEVVKFVKTRETVSISMLQRQFRIGYNRSARLVDDLEAHGIVGPQDGSKPRQVMIFEEETNES